MSSTIRFYSDFPTSDKDASILLPTFDNIVKTPAASDPRMPFLLQCYIGGLSIIGLYAVFRLLERSKSS